jgi:hypothetical protein
VSGVTFNRVKLARVCVDNCERLQIRQHGSPKTSMSERQAHAQHALFRADAARRHVARATSTNNVQHGAHATTSTRTSPSRMQNYSAPPSTGTHQTNRIAMQPTSERESIAVTCMRMQDAASTNRLPKPSAWHAPTSERFGVARRDLSPLQPAAPVLSIRSFVSFATTLPLCSNN